MMDLTVNDMCFAFEVTAGLLFFMGRDLGMRIREAITS